MRDGPVRTTKPPCRGIRTDGQPCATQVVGDGPYCFGHDPALAAKRHEARRRGGQNRATAKRLSKLMPVRLVPVFARLEQALEETHAGTLDPKQAQVLASLARALVAVLTAGELEERVRRLEQPHAS